MAEELVESASDFIGAMVATAAYPSAPRWRDDKEGVQKQLEWLCRWPPDLFAVTWAILQRTGAYRYVASPPDGAEWPPKPEWDDLLGEAAKSWFASFGSADGVQAPQVAAAMEVISNLAPSLSMEDLQHRSRCDKDSDAWKFVAATLTLHAFADQACEKVGMLGSVMPSGISSSEQRELLRSRGVFLLLCNMLLATTGTLSRLPKHVLVVLPKLRTPQRGLSIRTLSHHLCVYVGEVNAIWRTVPFLGLREHSVNLFLVPHPTGFSPEQFRVVRAARSARKNRSDRLFTFRSNEGLRVTELLNKLKIAEGKVGPIDVIMLPELAIEESELAALQRALLVAYRHKSRIPAVLTGIRLPVKSERSRGQREQNELVFSFFFAGKWYESRQQKHHRWCLDTSQLRQYSIAGTLSARQLWWESFAIGRRNQSFLLAAPWFCVAPLICEDLAQQDPLADLVRSVGPQLVAALLLDGPQLPERWPGRYASVLADDPGSAVITLTSIGVARNSIPKESISASDGVSVALWKDPVRGWRRLEHPKRARSSYQILTVSAQFQEEFTADGRSDKGATPVVEYDQVQVLEGEEDQPVAARQEVPPLTADEAGARAELRKLDLEELTRLVFAFDFMLDFPEAAQLAGAIAGGTAKAFELNVALGAHPGARNQASTEVANRIHRRIHARRKRSTLPEKMASEEFSLALARGMDHADSAKARKDKNRGVEWRTLLKSMRDALRALPALLAPMSDSLQTTITADHLVESLRKAQERAEAKDLPALTAVRAEWLIAGVFHYLIRMRLDRARRQGRIDAEDLAALHDLEETLQEASLLGSDLWDKVVGDLNPEFDATSTTQYNG